MEGFNLTHSQTIGELAKALSCASEVFKPVKKENVNPFFKSKYADLSAIIEATDSALSKYNLVIIQSPIVNAERAGVTTMLVHSTGEWMRGELLLPVTKWDAQGIGSAITYARRYSLQSFLNVAAEADDDANAAAGKESEAKAATMPRPPKKETPPKTNGESLETAQDSFGRMFWAKAKNSGKTEQAIRNYLGSIGYEHTGEVPPAKRDALMTWAGETQ